MENIEKKVYGPNGLTYLLIVLFLTALSVFLIDYFELKRDLYRYTVALPGTIALLFIGVGYKKYNSLFYWDQFKVKKPAWIWLFVSLTLYAFFSYVSSFISHQFFDGNFVALPSFTISSDRLLIIFLLAFSEEIGWRGYALPLLSGKIGLVGSTSIIGIIWALWHYPGYLVNFGAPNDIPFIVFSIWVIAASFIFTWLYYKSNRNVWTVVLLHTGANVALNIFPIMPGPSGTSATFYTMTILICLVATYLALVEFKKIKAE